MSSKVFCGILQVALVELSLEKMKSQIRLSGMENDYPSIRVDQDPVFAHEVDVFVQSTTIEPDKIDWQPLCAQFAREPAKVPVFEIGKRV